MSTISFNQGELYIDGKRIIWPRDSNFSSGSVLFGVNYSTGTFAPIPINLSGQLLQASGTPLVSEGYDLDITVVQTQTLDTEGRPYVAVIGHSSVATVFTVEGSADNSHWFQLAQSGSVTLYQLYFTPSLRYLRISSAAVAGPGTVDLIISATG